MTGGTHVGQFVSRGSPPAEDELLENCVDEAITFGLNAAFIAQQAR